MTLADAFNALWPVLSLLGGGYAGLLLYIRKQFEDRLREKDAQIADLTARLDRREEYVWRTLSASEATTALAQSFARGAGERQP